MPSEMVQLTIRDSDKQNAVVAELVVPAGAVPGNGDGIRYVPVGKKRAAGEYQSVVERRWAYAADGSAACQVWITKYPGR